MLSGLPVGSKWVSLPVLASSLFTPASSVPIQMFPVLSSPDRVVPKSTQITIKNGKVAIPAHSVVILTINRGSK